jgi:hypothetical protein
MERAHHGACSGVRQPQHRRRHQMSLPRQPRRRSIWTLRSPAGPDSEHDEMGTATRCRCLARLRTRLTQVDRSPRRRLVPSVNPTMPGRCGGGTIAAVAICCTGSVTGRPRRWQE